MAVQPWFDEDQERYEWELAQLTDAGWSPVVDDEARSRGALVIHVKVASRSEQIGLRIYYPPGFPYCAPQVAAPEVTLPAHQAPWLSALCLITGQREWIASYSAAKLVKEALDLLEASLHDPDRVRREEAPAPEPASFYLQYHSSLGIIIPPPMQDLAAFVGRWGTFKARPLSNTSLVMTHVRFLGEDSHVLDANAPLARLADTRGGDAIGGAWFWLNEHPPYPLPGGSAEDALTSQYTALWAELEKQHPEARARLRAHGRTAGREYLAVVYPDESGRRGEFIAGWFLVRIQYGKSGERFSFYRPLYWPPEHQVKGSQALLALAAKRVMVIGAGAMGSSVALELAKAGVGQLITIDPDHLSPANLHRHEAGIFELGLPKAHAVARRINDQAPWTQVTARGLRVGSGDLLAPVRAWNDYRDFILELAGVDLVVDTTAEPQVSALLNALAVRLRVPLIIGWATGGAWGGRVIRVRAPQSACYECVGWWNIDHREPSPPHDPGAFRYPQGCAHPSFGGAGFEAKAVALAVVRMAAATLCSEAGYPDFEHDHYVLAFRDETAQRETYWLPVPLSSSKRCATCSTSVEATNHSGAGEKRMPSKT